MNKTKQIKLLKTELLSYKLLFGQLKNAIESFENRTKSVNKMNVLKSKKYIFSQVVDSVCNYFEIDPENIFNTVRRRNTHVIPRQMVMYLMLNVFDVSCTEVGQMMKKNHATILHGRKTIENLLEYDKTILNDYLTIKEDLVNNKGFKSYEFII